MIARQSGGVTRMWILSLRHGAPCPGAAGSDDRTELFVDDKRQATRHEAKQCLTIGRPFGIPQETVGSQDALATVLCSISSGCDRAVSGEGLFSVLQRGEGLLEIEETFIYDVAMVALMAQRLAL